MSVLSANALLEQADELIETVRSGQRRQVDLRRGVSSAYYAAFHTVVTAAADEFVGREQQKNVEHGLVSRSIDHTTIRKICEDLGKVPISSRYMPYISADLFGPNLRAFMEAFPGLQRERHQADYDSLASYVSESAQGVVRSARAAIAAFWAAPATERRIFLYLVLFPLRR